MIDQSRLDQLEGDLGADELQAIIGVFLAEAGEAVADLALLISDGTAAARREKLHFLKGCARTIGAMRLGALCEALEEPASFTEADLRRLDGELRAVRDHIAATWLQRAG